MPLYRAASGGHDVVKLLIDDSANVTTHDNDGTSALTFSSFTGYFSCVILLMKSNVDRYQETTTAGRQCIMPQQQDTVR